MKEASLRCTQSAFPSILPTPINQTAYFLTGTLAGACTLPIEYIHQTLTAFIKPSPSPFLRSHLPAGLYRPAIRFWIFDIARAPLMRQFPAPAQSIVSSDPTKRHVHAALIGGSSGAIGGFAEVFAQSLFLRQVPRISALANQGSKLFLCFGSYTYLSNRFSDKLPPRPFWKCWIMGAMAGGMGSAILAAVEGWRGRALVHAAGKGAAVIGTVIAVQVTSCKDLLDWIGEE